MTKLLCVILCAFMLAGLCLSSCKEGKRPSPVRDDINASHNAISLDGGSEGDASPSQVLRTAIESCISEDVVEFRCDDFDGNGSYEAFALVGNAEDFFSGSVWYANGIAVQKLCEKEGYFDYNPQNPCTEIIQLPNRKAFALRWAYVSALENYVWTVVDGILKETAFMPGVSFNGVDKHGKFTADCSAYDGAADGTIKTYKPYYFYWDSELNDFREYGGAEISVEQFKRSGLICVAGGITAEELIEGIEKGGNRINSIYYRENGIINISYTTPPYEHGANYYRSFFYNGEGRLFEQEYDHLYENSGNYSSAHMPEIATYPEVLLPEINN